MTNFHQTAAKAIQTILQAAVESVDALALQELSTLPEWQYRWQFQNARQGCRPCEMDQMCEHLIASGHRLFSLTTEFSHQGFHAPHEDIRVGRSLAKLFGEPFAVFEKSYGGLSMWRVTSNEFRIYSERWLSQDAVFVEYRRSFQVASVTGGEA